MEVVYYFDEGSETCPVKEYLAEFLPGNHVRNLKILATIDQKIKFIQENPGRQASFIGTLHNHNFLEIKNGKDSNTVIRITYFIYNGKIILLNAFEKPSNYDTTRVKKEVEKHYFDADTYLVKFKENPNRYQSYE